MTALEIDSNFVSESKAQPKQDYSKIDPNAFSSVFEKANTECTNKNNIQPITKTENNSSQKPAFDKDNNKVQNENDSAKKKTTENNKVKSSQNATNNENNKINSKKTETKQAEAAKEKIKDDSDVKEQVSEKDENKNTKRQASKLTQDTNSVINNIAIDSSSQTVIKANKSIAAYKKTLSKDKETLASKETSDTDKLHQNEKSGKDKIAFSKDNNTQSTDIKKINAETSTSKLSKANNAEKSIETSENNKNTVTSKIFTSSDNEINPTSKPKQKDVQEITKTAYQNTSKETIKDKQLNTKNDKAELKANSEKQNKDLDTILVQMEDGVKAKNIKTPNKNNEPSEKLKTIINNGHEDKPIVTKVEVNKKSKDENLENKNHNNKSENGKVKIASNNTQEVSVTNVNTDKALTFDKIIESKQSKDNIQSSVLDQVNNKLSTEFSKNSSKITIALNPENLGKVNITLKSQGGVITAQIIAENSDVKDELSKGLESLKQSLSEKGVNVDNLTVKVQETYQSNTNNSDQNFNQNSSKFTQANHQNSDPNSQSNNKTSSESNSAKDFNNKNNTEETSQEELSQSEETPTKEIMGKIDYRV